MKELSPPMTQVVADVPLPPQAAHIDMDSPTSKRIRCSGSGVQRWREVVKDWLLEEEEYEAIPNIAILLEDPTTTYPRRAWSTIRAFHDILNTNISVWIHKLRRKGRSTLAAHGTSLLGSDGTKAKLRHIRNKKLLLNREAWNAVGIVDKSEWYVHLSTVGHLTQTISDPRISSWNVGPHGFRGGREEIFALFEKGDPIICLQDRRIPDNRVEEVKKRPEEGWSTKAANRR